MSYLLDTNVVIAFQKRNPVVMAAIRTLPVDEIAISSMIAGQALARDLTLVTRNTGEFRRVEGLRVEDWEG